MNIGACWLKEKDGKTYMSGQIRTPGLDLNFAIFKNEKKESENQPDYHIVWSPPKKETGEKKAADSPFDDKDIPF